jgi:hypothetical protein
MTDSLYTMVPTYGQPPAYGQLGYGQQPYAPPVYGQPEYHPTYYGPPASARPPQEYPGEEPMILTGRTLARILLGLAILGCGGYALYHCPNVTYLTATAGAAIGLTITCIGWDRAAPAANMNTTEKRYLNSTGGGIAIVICIAAVVFGIGAGVYYLTRWKPVASAIIFGLPAGCLVGIYLPRMCHTAWQEISGPEANLPPSQGYIVPRSNNYA